MERIELFEIFGIFDSFFIVNIFSFILGNFMKNEDIYFFVFWFYLVYYEGKK